jgi:arabinan endo-1,5-alpha-L-arabinosidase
MWTKTLDPTSPDFGFNDDTVVYQSNGVEDADAIDPSFVFAEGHLWISYGTYFGYIRVLELIPRPPSLSRQARRLMWPSTWKPPT